MVVGPDASDPPSLAPAFEGAAAAVIVTVVSGDFSKDAGLTSALIDAAVAAGVGHIVLVGSWTVHAPEALPALAQRFLGPEAQLKALAEAGRVQYTVLRGGYFMQNFLYVMAPGVKESSTVHLPPGVKLPVVDSADIGRSAAAVLASAGGLASHAGKVYEMSGPEMLSGADIAACFSSVLGRAVTYVPVAVDDAVKDAPVYVQELMRYLDARGEAAVPMSSDVKDLTSSVTSLKQFVEANKAAFE